MEGRFRSSVVVFIVVVSAFYLALATLPDNARATTHFVGGSGPGNYTTIQSGVDAAVSGDTVFVYSGRYDEHVTIPVTISFVGEDRATTIIDGSGVGDVVNVTANWVNISGFTVRNGTQTGGYGGIKLYYVHNCYLTDNILLFSDWGIYLHVSSNNTIVDNFVDSEYRAGVTLFESNHNTVVNNTITGSTDAVFIYDSENNTVTKNNFTEIGYGIYFWLARSNFVHDNEFRSTTGIAALLFQSAYNRIYHNNFYDNRESAFDTNDTNYWDNGYPSGGNFYDNFTAPDMNSGPNQDQPGSDAIVDSPFIVPTYSVDRYPLVCPYGRPCARPPYNSMAELSGKDLENITITWSHSPDDGTGKESVIGYEVRRSTLYQSDGSGYTPIIALPNGTSVFVDYMAGEGNPDNYFYQVCAQDLRGISSCDKRQVAKSTRPLSKGLNLVSIPLIQSDESLGKVLQTLSYDKVWNFNSSSSEWYWSTFSKPYPGILRAIDHRMGIWVNVTEASNLTVAGIVPSNTPIQLYAGWNLVGFPSLSASYAVADLKTETGATLVEGFDSVADPYHLRAMDDGEILQACHGYWIYVESGIIWTVTNA